MSDEVRRGDRYLRGEEKITITRMLGDRVEYATLRTGAKTARLDQTCLPLPPSWEKVGSGPKVGPMCLGCEKNEAEPGLFYCFDCVDAGADQWASMTPEQLKERVQALYFQTLGAEKGDSA